MAPKKKILFYVQHLLGIGHLVRAGRIAQALALEAEVLLVVGGDLPERVLPAGIEALRLAPVRAGDGIFSSLVHPDGRPFGDADKAARRDRLIEAFDAFEPDALLIEAFPFGRRPMRFELLPLLQRASARAPRPLIACSIRDILQTMRPERQAEAIAHVRRFFDLVLVHGDPAIFPLSASFRAAAEIGDRIRSTGLVGPGRESFTEPQLGETYDVVVSVGGGAVGAELLRAAIAARPRTSLAKARWLVLTGPNMSEDLVAPADGGLVVRTFEPNLPALLTHARVSVSQAGYNTVADLAAARCRAVLVPFSRGGETEQTQRAALLQDRGEAVALAETDLGAASLAAAIERALALPELPRCKLEGAEVTRQILLEALDSPADRRPHL